MKRSSGDKPTDMIEISDDESSKKPPQKTAKQDAELSNAQAILKVHQNFVKMEKDYQNACRMADEAQKRVAFLENLLDNKPEPSEDAEKEELKKKLTEVSAKLEDATRENGEMIKMDVELRKFSRMTIDSLQRKLRLQVESQNKHMGDLQKKIAETSAELEKAKSEAAIRDDQLKRLDKLEKNYQGVCRIAAEYEIGMNEAKARVIELENIIDKKPDASEDTEKEELKKKIEETLTELEKEKCKTVMREEQLNRLIKLEKDYKGVCRIAAEYEMGMNAAKARVVVLENIIDKKPVVVDDNLVDELRTKLSESSTLLEYERSEGAKREQQLQESTTQIFSLCINGKRS